MSRKIVNKKNGNHFELTIKEYLKKIKNNEIETCPQIQRKIVYNNDQQSFVIDSVLNNILLPTFYLGLDIDNAKKKYELIDGLQRTTSLENFYDNVLSWKIVNEDDISSKTYSDLTPKEKKMFENYKLSFNIIKGKRDDIRETFFRINTCGVPLTNWEVLWSTININGEISTFLEELQDSAKQFEPIFGSPDKRGKTLWNILKIVSQKTSKYGITAYCDQNKMQHWEVISNNFNLPNKCNFIRSALGNDINKNIYFDMFIWIKYYPCLLTLQANDINSIFIDKIREIRTHNNNTNEIQVKEYKEALKNTIYTFLNLRGEIKNGNETPMRDDSVRKFTQSTKSLLLSYLEKNGNNYKCPICGEWDTEDNFVVDHRIPHSRGGRTNMANAVIMCHRCNSKKSNS